MRKGALFPAVMKINNYTVKESANGIPPTGWWRYSVDIPSRLILALQGET